MNVRNTCISAGMLNQRVEIHSKSEASDDHGEITSTFTKVATRWASVQQLTGKELFEAQQIDARRTYKVTMRFFSGLTETYQLVFKSRIFKIIGVNDVMEQQHLHIITCLEDPTNSAN